MFQWLRDVASTINRTPLTFQSHSVYEEGGPFAEGGFAFVYKVSDVETREPFAMKRMLCPDAKRLKAAHREADILDLLPKHQNIVQYFGRLERVVEGKKEVNILLELCPHGNLLQFMNRYHGKVPENKLRKAFQDVAEAVFLLHSLEPPIAHRDLKLENILLGKDRSWKLVDFGSWSEEKIDLANATRQTLMNIEDEAAENVTMLYRPPELSDVYQRKKIGVSVDMWQLGCILYTLMFYRHPFQDSEALAISQANYTVPPDHAYSEKLEDVMHWLLAKDPTDRLTSRALVMILWQWTDESIKFTLPDRILEQKNRVRGKNRYQGGGTSPIAKTSQVGESTQDGSFSVVKASEQISRLGEAHGGDPGWEASF